MSVMLRFLKWEITFILNFHSLSCLLVLCAYHSVIFTVCVFVLCWVQPPLPSYPTPPTSWHNKVLCFYELTFLVVIMNGYHFSSKRTLFERTSFYRNFTRTVVWFSLPQYSHFFHIVSPRLDIIFSLPQMMTMISSPCPFYTRNTLFSR